MWCKPKANSGFSIILLLGGKNPFVYSFKKKVDSLRCKQMKGNREAAGGGNEGGACASKRVVCNVRNEMVEHRPIFQGSHPQKYGGMELTYCFLISLGICCPPKALETWGFKWADKLTMGWGLEHQEMHEIMDDRMDKYH